MSEKMRVSMHNGRGNSKHNDRSFLKDWTDDEIKEKAPHIDKSKIKDNYYWATQQADKKLSEGATFGEIELSFYNKYFRNALEETNQNYINQGHAERCKTMQDWYKSKQKAPFETILQVGDMNSNIDPQKFKAMCFDYVNYINKKYGKHIKTLNFAIHLDESSPHMHLRQVYVYEDKGVLKIGQNKALEQLGIELPDKNSKASRKNNRKMTLDKELRSKWQEIAKSYGYDIETKPRVNVRHKDKEEYINDQIAKKQDQLAQLNKTIEEVVKNSQSRRYKSLKKHLNVLGYSLVSNNELEALKGDYNALERTVESLETRNKMLQVKADELKKLKDNPSRLIYEAKKQSEELIIKAKKEAFELSRSHDYAALKNFKEHWERIADVFPERVKQLEKDYQASKKSGEQIQRSQVQEQIKRNQGQEQDEQSFFDKL